jgi:hypothetical protein
MGRLREGDTAASASARAKGEARADADRTTHGGQQLDERIERIMLISG